MKIAEDKAMGAPRDWEFRGKTYSVHVLSPYKLGRLNGWLRANTPDPLIEVMDTLKSTKDILETDERLWLLKDAKDSRKPKYETSRRNGKEITRQVGGWPPSFDSDDGYRRLTMGDGLPFFLAVVLEIDEKDAEPIAREIGYPDIERLSRLMSVEEDEPDFDDGDEDGDDDKAPAGKVTTEGSIAPDAADEVSSYVDPKV